MTYAVISDRGRQYTVKAGQKLRMDVGDKNPGDKIVFDRVLLLGGDGGTVAGTPEIPGATVEATILREGRGKKIVIYKIRRRKGYRRKQGHRQDFAEVLIDSVNGGGGAGGSAERRKT